ncbi:hypothetical protein OMP38_05450 [Cohnella ginsengisoli]|uniref:Uncharacterized protein n=1 Tax=Cohnella ginsengisoli TaxID=425004 RepID=A0A9X4QLC5_9BACL|nr:hypothetical protein [Cohnella ginsengisoli]MDG0790355.1 hypothetical protein [Cohnella ginsengisoli]
MKYKAGIWLLVFAILVSAGLPIGRLSVWAAGGDKTSALTELTAVVKQGSTVINPGDTINISNGDTLSVEVSFRVPVAGDDPAPPTVVEQGDTASFELSQGFTLLSGTTLTMIHKDPINGDKRVGTATLNSAGGSVNADILFDGDSVIFDENGGYYNVSGEFSAQLRYDNSGSAGDEGNHTITILGKTYTVVVPPTPVVYNVAKSGVADLAHNKIDWTVTLSATKGATAVDLKDYEFSDDLSNVGTYVPSSFTVGGVAATPVETGSVITYKFPDPSSGPQEVKFSTTIPDNKYYVNNVNQSISNTAQLLKDNVVVKKRGRSGKLYDAEVDRENGGGQS